MSYETDFLGALCKNMRDMNREREKQLESVVATASSIIVQRLLSLFDDSGYSDFDSWLCENYYQHVAPFGTNGRQETDPYIQAVFNMTKESSESAMMRFYIARSVNAEFKRLGFKCGLNENSLYFLEGI